MSTIKRILTSFWFQIACVMSGMFILLFGIGNLIVFNTGSDTFLTVVRDPEFQVQTIPGTGNVIVTPFVEAQRVTPLHERFRERFQSSLMSVTLIAGLASIIIGVAASQIITSQVKTLRGGMKSLRSNNYRVKLDRTGTAEFDELINEFNNMVDELHKVEELRKDLISDTSHELKTPVTSLKGQLEGIRDEVLEATPERIKTLLDQVDRLQNLVDTLQTYSRLRSKAVELKKDDVAMKELVDELALQNETALKKAKVKLKNEISGDLRLRADRHLLAEVFQNLIDNALRYAKATQITISASGNVITFADNGKGIDAKHLPYIFERFYRVEKSRNRATGGMGLGLAIVKEIVEAHGWEISAQSEKGLKVLIRTTQS
ncbi:MAG: two-component sensor histidine kinase [Candidatus Doudnabacteria bacterium]|nr:two-component sensor histidine kinase [Candidatus Doudnabacteria bacterium]